MVDLNQSLSPNFQLWEFVRSPTAINLGIDNTPNAQEISNLRNLCQQILQPAREALGPLKVNSGFRSAALNVAVGGSRTSDHRKGHAADIVPVNGGTRRLAEWVVHNRPSFDQVILEFGTDAAPDWIHLSANPRNRKQVLRATLQGDRTVYTPISLEAPIVNNFSPILTAGVKWFKDTFGSRVEDAMQGKPFSLDMVSAIALQETFEVWSQFYKKTDLSEQEKLKLCVGDTLDAPRRAAFPVNRAALEAVDRGAAMFTVARRALESLAPYSSVYKRVAETNPNKFCHGFGIFQFDLQHFRTDPDYFLEERWQNFDDCLGVLISELSAALLRAYPGGKTSLTDEEMVYVAIAYNRGSVDFSRGFKQGFRDQSGKYYGEYMRDYIQLAGSVT